MSYYLICMKDKSLRKRTSFRPFYKTHQFSYVNDISYNKIKGNKLISPIVYACSYDASAYSHLIFESFKDAKKALKFINKLNVNARKTLKIKCSSKFRFFVLKYDKNFNDIIENMTSIKSVDIIDIKKFYRKYSYLFRKVKI